jgi:cis-3-alkyl-4-acyloxetan-2-one decarboxylase
MYPFLPKVFSTPRGARMSYIDEGQGTDIVLMLHGNPTWSFYYRELVKEISPRQRCVVPDHVGMGLSEKPEDYSYTLATRIDDVAALVTSLGTTRVDLVVHDWGGAIGFGFAARYPELIRRIVVLNTGAFPSHHIPTRIALCRTPVLGSWFVRGLNGFASPAIWMAMHRRALTEAEKRAYLWPYRSWKDRVAIDAFVKDIPMSPEHRAWTPLQEAERAVALMHDRPTLICWGGRDFCFNDHFYHEWRQRMPHAEALYLNDAGHYVLEDAASDVVPRVASFLRVAPNNG